MIYARRQELQARRWDGLRRAWQVTRAFVLTVFWLIAWLIGLYLFVAGLLGLG
ncbi:MAG: hypothetical protein M5R40_07335 [Anaerolineae bacterium]|nr:hypothetical protein [Anaerolineae bacterium]